MAKNEKTNNASQANNSAVETAIRIVAVGLLMYWCFLLFRPFLTVMVWGIIISVAIYPIFTRVAKWLGGRKAWAASLLVVIAIGAILIPGVGLTGSVITTGKKITEGLDEGTLTVPPPRDNVKDWPVIGDQVYGLWYNASTNLEKTVQKYNEEVKQAAGWIFRSLATIGTDILLTLFALIIAGLLLVNADAGDRASKAYFTRMVGEQGDEYSDMARDTIRSVVQGVVLVALIQSVLAWLGFVMIGIPAAGVWAVIVLLLAVIQLPPLLIILPLIVYVFSYASTGPAIAFAIWGVIVSVSDAFLKPMFLGRGLQIPMLVILIGALGGMILHGIIGLFIGAVVMALGYKLYISWLNNWDIEEVEAMEASAGTEK